MVHELSSGRHIWQLASRKFWVSLVVSIGLLTANPARGQDGFDAQQFNPAVSQFTGFFSQPLARAVEAGRWEFGLLFNYVDDPLVLYDANDNRVASPISSLLTGNLLAVVGIANWMDIGIDVPLVLYQNGDDPPPGTSVPAIDGSFGIGDIRIVPRVMFVRPDDLSSREGFALGLILDTRLPTGKDERFQGEDFSIEPKLAFDFGFRNGINLGATVGYLLRTGDSVIENVEASDGLTWSAAFGFPLVSNLLLVPEIFGSWYFGAEDVDVEEIPVEVLLGLKWFVTPSWLLELGGGTGVTRGVGSPDYRLFLGVAFSPEPANDRDGDGIVDDDDACPDDPEDFDDWQDEDGCPDPDNDADGILDVDDSCPDDPEDIDGFEDENGCPDPDNDEDGILDADDLCPLDPEDIDEWQDEDGCPDPDNDADSILDVDDLCPNDPESFNGYDDEDGCPDHILVTCVAIEISDRIHFENDSDVIMEASFGLLNEIARVLGESGWVRLVSIEGHTDSRGSEAHNQDLSERRAASVRTYLIERGVEEDRLHSQGHGESRPIADNETDEGRAQNRRVEFLIVEQEGCPESPVRDEQNQELEQ